MRVFRGGKNLEGRKHGYDVETRLHFREVFLPKVIAKQALEEIEEMLSPLKVETMGWGSSKYYGLIKLKPIRREKEE